VLRAMQKSPAAVEVFFTELGRARGAEATLDAHVAALGHDLREPAEMEFRARDLVDRMAVAIQAALLLQHAPTAVAEAFCRSRIGSAAHHNFGALPRGTDCGAIIGRTWPGAS